MIDLSKATSEELADELCRRHTVCVVYAVAVPEKKHVMFMRDGEFPMVRRFHGDAYSVFCIANDAAMLTRDAGVKMYKEFGGLKTEIRRVELPDEPKTL